MKMKYFLFKNSLKRRAGFTLIELLVVVLIIGILAAIALPKYEVAVAKSRYTQLILAVDAIKKANQVYYMANGTYSLDMRNLDIQLQGCEMSDDGTYCTLRQNAKVVARCYVNDGTQYGNGQLKPVAYCFGNDLYYSSPYDTSNRYCYATSTNSVANQVCLSMGGVYQSENNGHKNYLLK